MSPTTRAVLLALAAALMFTLESVMAKALSGVPLATIVLARALGQLAATVPALLRDAAGVVRTQHLKLNLLRGALSGVSWFTYFTSFAGLPLATATVLSFSAVLFVTALAGPILGEKVGWRRWSATLVGFMGVIAIVRPGAVEIGWPVAAALISAFLGAAIMLTTKVLSRSERTDTIMFYIGVVTTAVALPFAAPGLAWPGWTNAGLLLGTAICGPIAMLFWINALRLADASLIAPISYARLLFATIFGVTLFAEMPDIWVGLGAALIIGSTLYITRREARLARLRASQATPAAASAASSGDASSPKSR
jgi:drug/metabolite transporter (DMT)-like permease